MKSNLGPGGRYFWQQQYNSLLADFNPATFLLPHQQLGAFILSTNPGNTKTLTLTINGTPIVFTFVSSIGVTAGNVLIGASAAATAANLLALIDNPQFTTATGVALTQANQQLLSYVFGSLAGTTLTFSSLNTNTWAPLTSFSGSTTATSDSYTANTMALYIEAGIYWIMQVRTNYLGGSTATFTAPSSQPRIDLVVINNAGTLSVVTGTEAVSPSVPAYPQDKIVIAEVYHVVGETAIYDNLNQQAGQGYIYNDARMFLNNLLPISQNTQQIYSADTGSANAYAATLNPALASYVTGQIVLLKAGNTNTTASTLNVNGIGATAIKKSGSLALVANDIVAGGMFMFQYDGTYWQLISASANANSVPFAGLFAIGATTHDISITGTQNIAHGLGAAPKKVKITANLNGSVSFSFSFGAFDGTHTSSLYVQANLNSSTTGLAGAGSSGNMITIYADNAGGNPHATATITVTSTNIVLTWSNSGSPTGTAAILWEAEA